jgi:recombinational DNA repair protein (RecF pathway)
MDVDKLTHGSYYLSLADAAALPGQGAPEVFLLLMKALAHLAYSELPPALVTLSFEARYMPLMGYLPRMDACAVCGRPVEGEGRFDAELGGAVCLSCPSSAPKMSNGARRILLRAPQTDLTLIPKLDGHPDWPEAARLYRSFVDQRIERRQKVEPPLP